jgi:hypothetical protein
MCFSICQQSAFYAAICLRSQSIVVMDTFSLHAKNTGKQSAAKIVALQFKSCKLRKPLFENENQRCALINIYSFILALETGNLP